MERDEEKRPMSAAAMEQAAYMLLHQSAPAPNKDKKLLTGSSQSKSAAHVSQPVKLRQSSHQRLDANLEPYNKEHEPILPYAEDPPAVNPMWRCMDQHLPSTAQASTSLKPSKQTTNSPDFKLRDTFGKDVTRDELTKGNIILSFCRGEWCPPCSLELRVLKKLLPESAAKGTTLIAASSALPNQVIVTSQKNEITFPILSNMGNGLVRQLNIVFKQTEKIKDFWTLRGGVDWQMRYGDESLEVPVPGTILVDKTGTIRNVHLDPN
ncbi:hypothetical protein M422DRAFT_253039 [Sphaerobolus stellatus SS14]|uniref:Thioredoxin domain-containing protein n=1 Tax=Sphaerobolus stellatus (strain SS14) TaxID=990650 RepID=A0A0C9V9Y5_SPHS4|nr:hypothetical protein M422DRAFT_253039 [Sphaerobolus stellatus SS14]